MQTNGWALRTDRGKDEWGPLEAQQSDGSTIVHAPYRNFSLFVCLVTSTRKVKTLSLQLLFVLDSGEINCIALPLLALKLQHLINQIYI